MEDEMGDGRDIERRGFNERKLLRILDRIADDMAMWTIATNSGTAVDPGTDETWVDRMWDHARDMTPCKCCGQSDCREDDERLWMIFHLLRFSGVVDRRAGDILNTFVFPEESVAPGKEPWPEVEGVSEEDDDEDPPSIEDGELTGLVYCMTCDCLSSAHTWDMDYQSLVCGDCGGHCS